MTIQRMFWPLGWLLWMAASACSAGGTANHTPDASPDTRAAEGPPGEVRSAADQPNPPGDMNGEDGDSNRFADLPTKVDAIGPTDALAADLWPDVAAPDSQVAPDEIAATEDLAARDALPADFAQQTDRTPADAPELSADGQSPDSGESSDPGRDQTAVPDLPTEHDAVAEVEDVPPLTPCPAPADEQPPTVTGRVYQDGDGSADSLYAQVYDPDTDSPIDSADVTLIGADSNAQRQTCPDGRFAFGAVPDGTYVLGVQTAPPRRCTSTNRPQRFPLALGEGHVTIVTFGDSIPSYGAQPYFPERLAALMAPLADVDNVNVAEPGTRTVDWLPETSRFQQDLVPQLPDADVVVVSLGGNDLQDFIQCTECTTEELAAMAAAFPGYVEEVESRLHIILAEVRRLAPQADVVYIIYPNYAHSSQWAAYAGTWIGLIETILGNTLRNMRRDMAEIDGIVLADLFAATDDVADLDVYLSDPLHLNEAGTIVWAREIFQALGGLRIGADAFGADRMFGFAPP